LRPELRIVATASSYDAHSRAATSNGSGDRRATRTSFAATALYLWPRRKLFSSYRELIAHEYGGSKGDATSDGVPWCVKLSNWSSAWCSRFGCLKISKLSNQRQTAAGVRSHQVGNILERKNTTVGFVQVDTDLSSTLRLSFRITGNLDSRTGLGARNAVLSIYSPDRRSSKAQIAQVHRNELSDTGNVQAALPLPSLRPSISI